MVSRVLIKWVIAIIFVIVCAGCYQDSQVRTSSLLTEKDAINALTVAGVSLESCSQLTPIALRFNGMKPTIWKEKGQGDNNFIIYVFDDFKTKREAEFEISTDTDFINNYLNKNEKFYSVISLKNILIIYTFKRTYRDDDPKKVKAIENKLKQIKNTAFKLNNGKILNFKGESEHWEAVITQKYYDHWLTEDKKILNYEQWVKADNSTVFIDHESYYFQDPAILRYKGKDIKEVGKLSYGFSDAYGSTWHSYRTLNEDVTLRLGDIGGYGFGVREDETYIVEVEWDGKKEIIELKAITI